MSVEEVRARILGSWMIGDESPDVVGGMNLMLDHLVLEVQAAMPCANQWDDPVRRRCVDGGTDRDKMCPSCQARAKLRVEVPA